MDYECLKCVRDWSNLKAYDQITQLEKEAGTRVHIFVW